MENIPSNPKKIPKYIMRNYVLRVRGRRSYQLCEIELYWYSDSHPDPYVHCNIMQTKFGKWYFHKKNDDGKYNGGTFKGLDMTFGRDGSYIGILIRSVRRIKTGKFIEGPCNCVDRILADNRVESIDELVSGMGSPNIFTENPYLYLKPRVLCCDIYKSIRVGLGSESRKYMRANYRYLVLPGEFKKYKAELARSLYKRLGRKSVVCKLIGTTRNQLKKWLENT